MFIYNNYYNPLHSTWNESQFYFQKNSHQTFYFLQTQPASVDNTTISGTITIYY